MPLSVRSVLTLADDEGEWRIHPDSRRAFSGRLLLVARALGVTPERAGAGYEFNLPLAAVSFRVPRRASPAQREALRRSRLRSRTPVATGAAEAPAAEGVS